MTMGAEGTLGLPKRRPDDRNVLVQVHPGLEIREPLLRRAVERVADHQRGGLDLELADAVRHHGHRRRTAATAHVHHDQTGTGSEQRVLTVRPFTLQRDHYIQRGSNGLCGWGYSCRLWNGE